MIATSTILKTDPSGDFSIYGSGAGDKVEMLKKNQQAIRESGFQLNRRITIGETVIEKIIEELKESRLSKPDLKLRDDMDAIRYGVSPTLQKLSQEIVRKLPLKQDCPACAVRSTAKGDSAGTGVYKSFYVSPEEKHIASTVQNILWHYFSDSAVQFRRRQALVSFADNEGIAITIEPLVGKFIGPESSKFAPEFSGYGYTSKDGVPRITIATGFADTLMKNTADGISIKKGEKITELSEGFDPNTMPNCFSTNPYLGPRVFDVTLPATVRNGSPLPLPEQSTIDGIFQRLESLEFLLDDSHYVEFSVCGNQVILHQLSRQSRAISQDQNAEESVYGPAICNPKLAVCPLDRYKIDYYVVIPENSKIPMLNRLNEELAGLRYAFVLPKNIITGLSGDFDGDEGVEFNAFSFAQGLFVVTDGDVNNLAGHFSGMLSEAGLFLGTITKSDITAILENSQTKRMLERGTQLVESKKHQLFSDSGTLKIAVHEPDQYGAKPIIIIRSNSEVIKSDAIYLEFDPMLEDTLKLVSFFPRDKKFQVFINRLTTEVLEARRNNQEVIIVASEQSRELMQNVLFKNFCKEFNVGLKE